MIFYGKDNLIFDTGVKENYFLQLNDNKIIRKDLKSDLEKNYASKGKLLVFLGKLYKKYCNSSIFFYFLFL